MSGVKAKVDAKIAEKKVMVFSKSYCPFCTKAKSVLSKYVGNILNPAEYEVWEMENDPECSALQAYLRDLTGASSVPRVFIGGKCIGGGDETAALDRSGKLKPMLEAL